MHPAAPCSIVLLSKTYLLLKVRSGIISSTPAKVVSLLCTYIVPCSYPYHHFCHLPARFLSLLLKVQVSLRAETMFILSVWDLVGTQRHKHKCLMDIIFNVLKLCICLKTELFAMLNSLLCRSAGAMEASGNSWSFFKAQLLSLQQMKQVISMICFLVLKYLKGSFFYISRANTLRRVVDKYVTFSAVISNLCQKYVTY